LPGSQRYALDNLLRYGDRLDFRYGGTWDYTRKTQQEINPSVKRLDRTLINAYVGIDYRNPCYLISVNYREDIRIGILDNQAQEFINRTFTITFSIDGNEILESDLNQQFSNVLFAPNRS